MWGAGGVWVATLAEEATLGFSRWEPGILNCMQCAATNPQNHPAQNATTTERLTEYDKRTK